MSDDWDNKTFSNGSRRGKTYLHVSQNDEEFCKMVRNGEQSPFIPEDFKDFLLTKATSLLTIKEKDCCNFLAALTPEIREVLRNILGDVRVKVGKVRPPCDMSSDGFIGRFYHFFIKKCVFNLTDTDGYNKFIDSYASIFPFHVSSKISHCRAGILNDFDEKLYSEMQAFLVKHFDDVQIRSISNIFFANIMNFKAKNFSEKTLSKSLKNLNVVGLSMQDDKNDVFRRFHHTERCDYLKDFPRVNEMGANFYRDAYNLITEVTKLYKPDQLCVVSVDKYRSSSSYLKKLPEINFYELYSLLNPEFLRTHRREYVYRFQKYLFFFIHALNSELKAVFFIDDALFECMKSLRAFRKSRDDVFDLMYELAAMAIIFRRKGGFNHRDQIHVNKENLQHVKGYIEDFPNISKAVVNYEVKTSFIESSIFISTEDDCMNTCVRKKRQNSIENFYELILHGALSPRNIKRLVIYNALTGEESSIAMPQNKEPLVEFMRTYNTYDFSKPLAPEKFITWGREKYYEGDVANWDSRSIYKAF